MLQELNTYMFTFNRMNEIANNEESKKNVNQIKNNKSIIKLSSDEPQKTNLYFTPKQRDSLFWCFYIAKHGLHNFRFIKNFFIEENAFKISSVELSRKEKAQIKAFKVKIILFESQLVLEKKISFEMLQGLCILYKVNILLVRKRCYIDLCYFPENPKYIIEEERRSSGPLIYKIKSDTNINDETKIRNELWKQESINKPLRAISAYKSSDLQEICKRLQINIVNAHGKNKTKPELYISILEELN